MAIHREKDPFDSADERYMSGEDYGSLQRQQEAWSAANEAGDQAGAKAAHDAAETLRSKYNYSGGMDGSGYNPIRQAAEETARGGGFSYGSAPDYTSKYQRKIDALMQGLMNRPAFSYDHTKDPLYAQYEKTYTRNGERAMQDTLGQVSARTGGLASSYAGTAAQQTYDGYMGALNDKIPELQQLAYSMYQNEGNDKRANLEMLSALEAGDYSKYADLLNQYNNDRNFNYGAQRDQVGDAWKDKEWQHGLDREGVDDGRYEDETAYGKEQDALAWDYKNRSSSGGSSGGGYSGGGGAEADYDGLFEAAQQSNNPASYIATHFKDFGFSKSTGLSADYGNWEKRGPKITDVSQLGKAAMGIASGMSRSNSGSRPDYFADTIETALKSGSITESEADFLIKAFGF